MSRQLRPTHSATFDVLPVRLLLSLKLVRSTTMTTPIALLSVIYASESHVVHICIYSARQRDELLHRYACE